jgi:hypothetical protein
MSLFGFVVGVWFSRSRSSRSGDHFERHEGDQFEGYELAFIPNPGMSAKWGTAPHVTQHDSGLTYLLDERAFAESPAWQDGSEILPHLDGWGGAGVVDIA